jgi:hypothetical protein
MLRREMTTRYQLNAELGVVASHRYVRAVTREIHSLTAHPMSATTLARTANPTASGGHRGPAAPPATHH